MRCSIYESDNRSDFEVCVTVIYNQILRNILLCHYFREKVHDAIPMQYVSQSTASPKRVAKKWAGERLLVADIMMGSLGNYIIPYVFVKHDEIITTSRVVTTYHRWMDPFVHPSPSRRFHPVLFPDCCLNAAFTCTWLIRHDAAAGIERTQNWSFCSPLQLNKCGEIHDVCSIVIHDYNGVCVASVRLYHHHYWLS